MVFALASTEGAIGIVAVLSALYPVVTVVLARLVLGERLSVSRRVGGVLALAGRRCSSQPAQTLKRTFTTSPSSTT